MATGNCPGQSGHNVPPQCGCSAVICQQLHPGSWAFIDPAQACCTAVCVLPNGDLTSSFSCPPNSVPYPPAASTTTPVLAILVGVAAAGGMIYVINRKEHGQPIARRRATGQSRHRGR